MLKKLLVGGVMLALVLTVVGGASTVSAQSMDLCATVDALAVAGIIAPANVAAAKQAAGCGVAAPASASYTFTRSLTLGDTGADVTALQNFLISNGNNIPAGATGYFGAQTQAALAAYQAAKGITPAVGYFGPVTMASVNANTIVVAPVVPGTPVVVTPVLSGEGELDFDVVLDSNVSLDLGESETVIEVEVEAEDGDVSLDRVDFLFNDRPWLYFDEVNLLIDGKEVASLSRSSDFKDVTGGYRARFSGLNLTVEEDATAVIGLELVVLSSMSGDRVDESVEITMDDSSVRYMDGSGTMVNDGPTPDVVVTFDDTFGEGDFDLSVGDSSPENATILLSENSRTNDVTVLTFNVEADDSDVEVKDVTVNITSSASSTADTLYRAYLYQGSNLLKSTSVSSTTIVFSDVDYMVDEDDEELFTVKVDFNKVDGIDIGTITVVSVKVDAENSDYQAKSDTLTVSETHKLVSEGLVDTYTTKTAAASALGDDTIGKFTFKFDLTAYEDDFYVAESATGFGVTLENTNTSIISQDIASTNATLVGSSYRIAKGQTRTFTVQVEVQSSTSTQSARISLDDVDYYTNSGLTEGLATLELDANDYRSSSVTIRKN